MEKKNAFTITRARPEDAAALLDYLKIVGGETDNLSFGAEDIHIHVEEKAKQLAEQENSRDTVLFIARANGEIIGEPFAAAYESPGRIWHRCAKSMVGPRRCLCADAGDSEICGSKRF